MKRQVTLLELFTQAKQPRKPSTEGTQETASNVSNSNREELGLNVNTSGEFPAVAVVLEPTTATAAPIASTSSLEPDFVHAVAVEPESSATAISSTSFESDIGLYVPLSSATTGIPSHVCVLLLTNPWTPPDGYIFPGVQECGKTRKFQEQWLKRFPWLVYSPSKEGGFCKFCALFAPEAVRNQKLGRFISVPLNRYKDAIERCTSHEQSEYHKSSMTTR
jgi:hypothetical protein